MLHNLLPAFDVLFKNVESLVIHGTLGTPLLGENLEADMRYPKAFASRKARKSEGVGAPSFTITGRKI